MSLHEDILDNGGVYLFSSCVKVGDKLETLKGFYVRKEHI